MNSNLYTVLAQKAFSEASKEAKTMIFTILPQIKKEVNDANDNLVIETELFREACKVQGIDKPWDLSNNYSREDEHCFEVLEEVYKKGSDSFNLVFRLVFEKSEWETKLFLRHSWFYYQWNFGDEDYRLDKYFDEKVLATMLLNNNLVRLPFSTHLKKMIQNVKSAFEFAIQKMVTSKTIRAQIFR